MTHFDSKRLKQKLLSRQAELLTDIEASKDASKTVELDQSRVGRLSRMDAMQSQAMSQELKRRRQIELEKVMSALIRLDTDDFGLCLSCDEAISQGRLAFDPAVTLCIICAEKKS